MKSKIIKSVPKKPETNITLKQQIITLQNEVISRNEKILKLQAENEKLKQKIKSNPGLMATVVAALNKIEHDKIPKK